MENTNTTMSIEDIRNRILLECKVNIEENDPTLFLVPMFSAFLEQLEINNEKSRNALKAIYSEQAENFQSEVEKGYSKINLALEKMSVEAVVRVNTDHVNSVKQLKTYVNITTGLIFCSLVGHLVLFILG